MSPLDEFDEFDDTGWPVHAVFTREQCQAMEADFERALIEAVRQEADE